MLYFHPLIDFIDLIFALIDYFFFDYFPNNHLSFPFESFLSVSWFALIVDFSLIFFIYFLSICNFFLFLRYFYKYLFGNTVL